MNRSQGNMIISYEEFKALMSKDSLLRELEKQIQEEHFNKQQKRSFESSLDVETKDEYKKTATALSTYPRRFPTPLTLIIDKHIIQDIAGSRNTFYELYINPPEHIQDKETLFNYATIAVERQKDLKKAIYNHRFFDFIERSNIFNKRKIAANAPKRVLENNLHKEYKNLRGGYAITIIDPVTTKVQHKEWITGEIMQETINTIQRRLTNKGMPKWDAKTGQTFNLKVAREAQY